MPLPLPRNRGRTGGPETPIVGRERSPEGKAQGNNPGAPVIGCSGPVTLARVPLHKRRIARSAAPLRTRRSYGGPAGPCPRPRSGRRDGPNRNGESNPLAGGKQAGSRQIGRASRRACFQAVDPACSSLVDLCLSDLESLPPRRGLGKGQTVLHQPRTRELAIVGGGFQVGLPTARSSASAAVSWGGRLRVGRIAGQFGQYAAWWKRSSATTTRR